MTAAPTTEPGLATSPPDVPGEEHGPLAPRPRRVVPLWASLLAVVVLWWVASRIGDGRAVLYLPGQGSTDVHDRLTDLKADLIAGRDTNVVMQVVGVVSDAFNGVVERLQGLVSTPDLPRPVPQVGWLGVLGIAGWVSLAIAGWRHALVTMAALGAVGLLGYWSEGMDTLVITFVAVALCLLVGLPLAVWMSASRRVDAVVTPVLDVLQTFPAFVYLAPMALFFSLGPAIAVAVTVLYALPPAVRISALALRRVSETTLEATTSLGQTGWQRLVKVQLPMARPSIIVGVNQTMMAALSMSVVAGFVNGPGLGKPVLRALTAGSNQVGVAFVAGASIVLVAIMLDRVTTAAGERTELVARGGGGNRRTHRIVLAVAGVAALGAVQASRTYFSLAEFPTTEVGPRVAAAVQSATDWTTSTFSGLTTGIQESVTTVFINPLQDLVAGSPWFVTGLALLALSQLLAGWRGALSSLVCLTGIHLTDLWYDAMVTLTSVLVATLFVMVVAVVLGTWMARGRLVDRLLRPLLDAGQVMPSFVYLIPVLALFGPGRFTAIVAAFVYAVPVATKLVADGVRQVPVSTVEAATAAGSTPWQVITKVQLPMARGHLVLAANQGLLFVLAMVVIGGLVGGGALGYDAVLGFSRGEFFGKGVAAGIAIVLLGMMVDRVARAAAARDRGGPPDRLRPDLLRRDRSPRKKEVHP